MSENNTFDPNRPRETDGRFAEYKSSVAPGALTIPPETDGAQAREAEVGPYTIHCLDVLEPVPAWPEGLPEPEARWGYSDGGGVSIHITAGDADFHTFDDQFGGVQDSLDDFGETAPEDWTEEQIAAVHDWAKAVHKRADFVVGQIDYQATHQGGVQDFVDDIAVGDWRGHT